jgi:hypothetical protein
MVFLADRPNAVAAPTRIFTEEIERLLYGAAGPTRPTISEVPVADRT